MIDVRSSPIHGRGVFAVRPIRRGATFHTAHLLPFGCEQAEALSRTTAASYVFHIEDCGDDGSAVTGIALSPISFVNHQRPASAAFTVDPATRTISFSALRDIAADEEITIDYGDFAEKLGLDRALEPEASGV